MQSILELIFKTSKQGSGGKQAAAELKNLKAGVGEVTSGLLGFNAANVTAAGAIIALGGFLKGSTDKFVAYGKSMTEMAAVTGTGVEETSRMVQMLDDFGLAQEKVNTIMQQAAKKGFVMSTDGLADLADEYNSLNTQQEKNELMTRKLGRAGLELNKVMEAGSEAIREAAAAQADGLVLTAEEAAQAEQLRMNIDALNDTWEAFALTVGGKVAEALNSVINKQQAYQDLIASGVTIKELNNMTQAQKEAALAALELSESQEWVATHSREAKEMLGGYNDTVSETPGAIDPAIEATERLSTVMKGYNDQLLFNIASQNLDADAAMGLAEKMGMVDANTAMAYDKTAAWKQMVEDGTMSVRDYELRILGLQKAIANLQDKVITVTVNLEGGGGLSSGLAPSPGEIQNMVQQNQSGYANGTNDFIVPPGFPNDSYLMPVSSGEHVRVENDRMRWTGEGSGMTVNFNGPIQVDSEANYQKTLRRLSQDLTKAMRNN